MSQDHKKNNIPKKTKDGITFFPVPEFTDAEIAFGASGESYFNRYKLPDIPCEFERTASGLFFNGGEIPKLHSCVDKGKAIRAINALLTSFAPAHEAKIATVAYAIWLWTHETALDSEV